MPNAQREVGAWGGHIGKVKTRDDEVLNQTNVQIVTTDEKPHLGERESGGGVTRTGQTAGRRLTAGGDPGLPAAYNWGLNPLGKQ